MVWQGLPDGLRDGLKCWDLPSRSSCLAFTSLGNTHRFYYLKIGHSGHSGKVFKYLSPRKILTPEILRKRSYEILNIL